MNMTLENAIQLFLVDQEIKGNSLQTIKYYDVNLRYFKEFLTPGICVSEITLLHLKNYLISLRSRTKMQNHPFKPKVDKPIKSISIQTYIRAVRVFIKWLQTEGYISQDLHSQFKLPKATKNTIEILSDEEIQLLLKSMKQNTEIGLRNSCIVALMLDSGLRKKEALYLDYDNIHLSQGVVKVHGKGDKERIVPLGLYTKKLLLKYISGYRSMPVTDTKRLFIDKNCKVMSDSALKQLFVRLRNVTKISRLHPHILRHTFATKYLMNGGDIFSLQQILGHTSLEMVRRYSHLASAYVVHKHKQFSPLDNIELIR